MAKDLFNMKIKKDKEHNFEITTGGKSKKINVTKLLNTYDINTDRLSEIAANPLPPDLSDVVKRAILLSKFQMNRSIQGSIKKILLINRLGGENYKIPKDKVGK